MINSASKWLKITLKVIKFSKPETKFPKKIQVEGDIPFESFEGVPIPPLVETLFDNKGHTCIYYCRGQSGMPSQII
jgi:hypothetical protein